MEELKNFYGRIILKQDVPMQYLSFSKEIPSFILKQNQYYCQRCNSIPEDNHTLPDGQLYCRECLIFGRNSQNIPLVQFDCPKGIGSDYLVWIGLLTPFQQKISDSLTKLIFEKKKILVHAVTGAGKTEMIYQVVNEFLKIGKWVAIASPRVDVCLELHSRLSKDFSCGITLLHAQSKGYQWNPIIIMTTHQLLKFRNAFDLLIIDEVDAFPYVGNDVLHFATNHAIKEEGCHIFLTATSTKKLEREIQKGRLYKLTLPRRFHGNPLVVPKLFCLNNFKNQLEKGRLPKKLIIDIENQRKTNFPLLCFVPTIVLGEQLKKVLEKLFEKEAIAFVCSQTINRHEIIELFRLKKYSILITSTILERGVTFPGVDVFVLEAHHYLFTKSSLIQIAGRVGRSIERPTGKLNFYHNGKTLALVNAIKDIKQMNRKGEQI
ncbi:hypothetical protein HMPREF9318_01342 [Streptococcus urinalis FB127-CNA-2]|uniref:DEAD/DEAH box helicase n=1 Tax=Streptococcus urinalis 2285-97 TaxID=764291 RepID=G5KCS1_9STRE|nr:DEAD/DEAH box helicase [Streptococcus urinalis]EHJ55850.1 DEAD/DEAH box helicase [Streptococcus urinalis 2285-97]EKS19820.1 hypothetical protein HMPREF9318_01342 [Streptococcus urinalis FB127-CNA-2]VEF31396.1 competence ComFA-like protein [Streptococcus urinalis]